MRLLAPVDVAPLVAWRIGFGTLMVVEGLGSMATGWVREAYIAPTFHFTYFGFEWVRPIAGYSMYLHFSLIALFGALVACGLFYRVASVLLAIAWTYAFLLEKAFYQNHYYLMVLVAWLMVLVPAERAGSVDAWRKPEIRTELVPAWSIDVFRLLLTVVYLYAGIAKINPDWLALMPIENWLAAKAEMPVVGKLYASRAAAYAFAYGGLAFDLSIGPLLWWKRTRHWAIAVAVVFHLVNLMTFTIGIFPLLAIAMTSLFLPPQLFRRLLSPLLGKHGSDAAPATHRLVLPLLGAFFALQLLIPLRHHLIDSDVDWSEEGHRFSWRMMLRAKSGAATFEVRDPATGERFPVLPEEHLHGRQIRKLATHPDMIWQFSQYLDRHYREKGIADPEVRVRAGVSLNFRPRRPLIDSNVDLSRVEYQQLSKNDWILPLQR